MGWAYSVAFPGRAGAHGRVPAAGVPGAPRGAPRHGRTAGLGQNGQAGLGSASIRLTAPAGMSWTATVRATTLPSFLSTCT